MFREFNVKFEDVEMLGGADNLLEGTEITKVIVRGDNNKMSSLDSMLKNCNELDTVEGELDLNGVSDIDNLLEGTELVKSINLKNINNENISANNSFPHVDQINIGGELYNKKAMQNVIASKDWTFDNITYSGNVGENLLAKSATMIDDDKTTIKNTLEQKARGFEIIGQTYENLVVGSGEVTLLDELTLESVDGNSKEFNPHLEQPVCVETIEGETYQNLIEGKGEYKLTDTFSTTWTESNNSIENPPSMIEIPEIFGNTVQGFANCVTTDQIVTSLVNTINSGATDYVDQLPYNNRGYLTVYSSGLDINDYSLLTDDCFIQLKPSTTYSYNAIRVSSTQNVMIHIYSTNKRIGTFQTGSTFTTDSTGKVIIYPLSVQNGQVEIKLVEGKYNLTQYPWDYDLNYIQSVGDLYVDESGEPILDEEGNEQYKLDMISHGYVTDAVDGRAIIQNLSLDRAFINVATVYGTPTRAYFHCIAKIDTTKAKTGTFCTFSQGGDYSIKYNSTDHSLKLSQGGSEYFLSCVNHNEPFSITIKQSNDDKIIHVYFNGIEVVNIVSETMGFSHGNFVAFNSQFHTESSSGCNYINIIYAQCSKDYGSYVGVNEDDWNNINKWNKTTILMPQPLRRAGYERYGYNNNGNQHDKPIRDLLYYDAIEKKFFIKKYVMTNYVVGNKFIENTIYRQYNTREIIPPVSINQTLGHVYAIRPFLQSIDNSKLSIIHNGGTTSQSTMLCTLKEEYTVEESDALFGNVPLYYGYYKNDNELYYEIIETKILEKPSLETYSPKTYISTNTEIQPSQMSVTNKKVDFIPLGLQPNKDYTLQLDSIGKNDKPITVNLGGTETTVQPINDTSKHHKVVVRTPNTLTTDKLDLSGEGVVVNDVMLFEGGSNEIKQDVEYVEGIESIGELVENLFPIDVIENIKTNYDEYKNNYYKKEIQLQPNTTYSVRYLGKSRGYGYGLIIGGKENITGSHSWLCDMNLNSGITTKTFTTDLTGKLTFGISFIGIDSISSFLRQETKVQIEIGNNASSEYFEGERYKIDILTTNGVKNLVNTNPNNWVVKDSDSVIIKSSIKVNKGKTYTVFNSMGQWVAVYESDLNGNQYNLIRQDNTGNWSFIATSEYIKVSLWNISYVSDKLSQPHNMNVRIFEGCDDYGYNGYEERKLSIQSILLPQPLNKIGDLKDKFYWDENKGHYCIEQNICSIHIDIDMIGSGVHKGDTVTTLQGQISLPKIYKQYSKGFTTSSLQVIPHATYGTLSGNTCMLRNDYMFVFIQESELISIDADGIRQWFRDNDTTIYFELATPQIIDLPHLNKKYSLDTYMPTTYLECTNSPMQPSRLLLESDTVRYKPSSLEADTDYTVQFECKEKSDKKVKLNLGGTEKEVDATVGLNHVSITTPSELSKDRLYLSGAGNKVADIIVAKGEMNQYPEYFNGVQSVGELQDDGTYKIEVSTNNGGFKNLFDINNFFVNQNNRGSYVVSSEDNSITSNYTDWHYTVETNIDLKAGKEYLIKLDFEGTTTHTSKYALIMLGDKGYNLNSYNHADFEKVIEHTPYTEQDLKVSFNIVYTPSSDKTIYFGLSTGLRAGGSIKIKNIEIAEYNDNLNMDIPLKSHNISITSNNPLAKGDKLYWNKSNKRYEIDRGGNIEVPTVSGDVIDLPRLYQREDTHFSTSTGNIKPSKVKLDYNDLD